MNTSESLIIRPALEQDIPSLTDIYNYYIEHTPVTFEMEQYTPERRKTEWFNHFSDSGRYRLFTAELDGRAVGYASSSPFRKKAAYDTSVESSVYVHSEFGGMGIGTLLYERLFNELAEEDVHRVYGLITVPNEASIALHRKFGFSQAGLFNEAGMKLGSFRTVALLEKKMEDHGKT